MGNNNIKKDEKLSLLRIISCILVILVHITNKYLRAYNNISLNSYIISVIINAISRYTVPFFFMISGIVLMEKKFNKLDYIKRLKKLIYPLIFWSIIYYLIDMKNYSISQLICSVFNPIRGHLWFMYALIGIYVALPFISKMIINLNNDLKRLFIKLWFFSGLYFLINIILARFQIDVTLKYKIPLFNGTYYLGYFIIGYIIYKYIQKKKFDKKTLLLSTGAIVSFLIISITTILITINDGIHYEKMFGYSNILIMIMSISAFILYYKNCDKIINCSITKDIIKYIEPYIFGIYLSHVILIDKLLPFLRFKNISAWIGIPMFTFIIFTSTYLIIYLLKKIKFLSKFRLYYK